MSKDERKKSTEIIGEPVSKKQLVLAFVIAAIADTILAPMQAPGLTLFVDLLTAGLLFVVLGWRVILLPALIAEAIPGIGIFPFWVLVVGSIAAFGTIRRPGTPSDSANRQIPPADFSQTSNGQQTDSSAQQHAVPPPYYSENNPETLNSESHKKSKNPIIDVLFEDVKDAKDVDDDNKKS